MNIMNINPVTRTPELLPRLLAVVLLLGIIAFLPPTADAVPIVPGQQIVSGLPGSDLITRPELAGVVVADQTLSWAQGSNTNITGTVRDFVIQETGTGTLDFYLQITTDANNPFTANIGGFDRNSFVGFTTDIGYRTDLGGTIAWEGALSDGRDLNIFLPSNPTTGVRIPIPAGQTTYAFFIKTDATQFDLTGISAFLNGGTAFFTTYQPIASQAVPEPSSLLLLGSAVAGLGLWRKFKARS